MRECDCVHVLGVLHLSLSLLAQCLVVWLVVLCIGMVGGWLNGGGSLDT